MLCLAGFLVTIVTLLVRGEDLLVCSVKAILVFIVLYLVQNFFGNILVSVVDSNSPRVKTVRQADNKDKGRN